MTALTTAERQSRRQAALDQKAQALGYPTWRKLETDLINDEMEITVNETPKTWNNTMSIYREDYKTRSDYSKALTAARKHYGFSARVDGGMKSWTYEIDYRTWKNQK